jgi:hypothetical protein
MIVSSISAEMTVTSSAAPVLAALAASPRVGAVGRAIAKAAIDHHASTGDGTNTFVQLAAAVLVS